MLTAILEVEKFPKGFTSTEFYRTDLDDADPELILKCQDAANIGDLTRNPHAKPSLVFFLEYARTQVLALAAAADREVKDKSQPANLEPVIPVVPSSSSTPHINTATASDPVEPSAPSTTRKTSINPPTSPVSSLRSVSTDYDGQLDDLTDIMSTIDMESFDASVAEPELILPTSILGTSQLYISSDIPLRRRNIHFSSKLVYCLCQ